MRQIWGKQPVKKDEMIKPTRIYCLWENLQKIDRSLLLSLLTGSDVMDRQPRHSFCQVAELEKKKSESRTSRKSRGSETGFKM